MCDEEVLNIENVLQSVPTRMPKIVLKRVEGILPPLKEGLVSFLCLCRGKGFYYLVH
jgi:hypothetical protein